MNDMKECPVLPITDLLECIIDNRGKSCPTEETGFPLIATNCIKHSSIYPTFENIRYVSEETLHTWFRAELKPNDILFVNKGTPGRVCLVPDPVTFCAAQDMVALRVNEEKIYYRYLFAVLRSKFIQDTIANFHVGIAIPHFKKSDMKYLKIPVPRMEIQKKIGDLYFELSAKIENNNMVSNELEEMVNTIFDYFFLQFEFPNEEGKPYVSSGGKMHNEPLLKREVPDSWYVAKLDDCIDTIIDHRGLTPKKLGGDWASEGVYALSAKIVKNNKLIGLEDANIVSNEMYERWMPEKLQEGDILMTSEAPLGEFYYLIGDVDYCLSQRLFALRANKEICSSTYLFYELYRGNGFSQIMGSQSGSTVFGIRQDELRKIKILVPPKTLQDKFEESVIDYIRKIRSNDKQNRELARLRDFLLPLMLSGQLGFDD